MGWLLWSLCCYGSGTDIQLELEAIAKMFFRL